MRFKIQLIVFLLLFTKIANAQLIRGIDRIDSYLPALENKNIAVVANHASYIGQTHLVDTLIHLKVKVGAIFSPEHGFKGNHADGEKIENSVYRHIPVYSLYGKHAKPSKIQLEGIDLVLFDLQDVGTRCYTYLSTLSLVMQACAENDIPLIVLDRPNPNAYFIDGPVLEKSCSSFVGKHAVPLVYGMTIGEYACMLNGEKWHETDKPCDLKVIKMLNYDRNKTYQLPIAPSPNLPNHKSVLLYPSLCLFEGTTVSIGRGTNHPFTCVGKPGFSKGNYHFTPQTVSGVSENPPFKNQKCSGYMLEHLVDSNFIHAKKLNLSWLLEFYQNDPNPSKFFTNYFRLLAGTPTLQRQIEQGLNEEQIRETWQPGLENFKRIRSKYLLYPDHLSN